MTENNIVLPGEKLSTSEELLSGEGTFEEDGIIRAARVGKYIVDEKYRRALVKPVTTITISNIRANESVDFVSRRLGLPMYLLYIAIKSPTSNNIPQRSANNDHIK